MRVLDFEKIYVEMKEGMKKDQYLNSLLENLVDDGLSEDLAVHMMVIVWANGWKSKFNIDNKRLKRVNRDGR